MSKKYYFTSESVTEGHPDKVCDQIADAILDEALRQDPYARVACEVMVSTGLVVIAGEISGQIKLNYKEIAKKVISDIGYQGTQGFSADSVGVILSLDEQSADIALGVNQSLEARQSGRDQPSLNQIGAGDQGIMFGYADSETETFMPLAISLAHDLTFQLAKIRKEKFPDLLKPDGKAQVTVAYIEGKPVHIDTVVISAQHDQNLNLEDLKEIIRTYVLNPILPDKLFDKKTKIYINPTGRFVIGGPQGDTGLTGRKIIVDTYGGYARHGGGALSGKDPTKVDRSANYIARYIAKNLVAAGLAKKCEIQLSYAIGIAKPISIHINTFSTGVLADEDLAELIKHNFDLSPASIIANLQLRRPIYQATAAYGHFGRKDLNLPWEKLDLVDLMKSLAQRKL